MRVAMFSVKNYERRLLDQLSVRYGHEFVYFKTRLEPHAGALAAGFPAVSISVNDLVDREVLNHLATGGTKLVATRSTGFNQIAI
jgi:D-lactate dehydrogenase